MEDNGRGMQVLKPGDNLELLEDGAASSVLNESVNEYIRLFTFEEGVKCHIHSDGEADEDKAHTLEKGSNYWICTMNKKITVFGNTTDVELMW